MGIGQSFVPSNRIDLLAYSKRGVEFWLASPDHLVFIDNGNGLRFIGELDDFLSKLRFYAGMHKLVPTDTLKGIIRETQNNPAKFYDFPLAWKWDEGRSISVSGIERRDVERARTAETQTNGAPARSDEGTPVANSGPTEQPDLFTVLRSPRQRYSR